jgi:hypothetical protein
MPQEILHLQRIAEELTLFEVSYQLSAVSLQPKKLMADDLHTPDKTLQSTVTRCEAPC